MRGLKQTFFNCIAQSDKREKLRNIFFAFCPKPNFTHNKTSFNPAGVAWLVERQLHKNCHILAVDRIQLGTFIWYRIYRRFSSRSLTTVFWLSPNY